MNKRITASCLIRNHQVWYAGDCLYQHPTATDTLPDFLNSCYRWLGKNYGKFFKMDTLSKLGWVATELLANSVSYQTVDVGVILQNRSSSYDVDCQHQATIQDQTACYPSPALFVYTLPNIVIGEICIRHNFQGETALFVMPAFDALFQVQYVDYLLDEQLMKAGIGGWIEAGPDGYEAFLYAVEVSDDPQSLPHTAAALSDLYHAFFSSHCLC